MVQKENYKYVYIVNTINTSSTIIVVYVYDSTIS